MGDDHTWPAVVVTVHRVNHSIGCCRGCAGPWYMVAAPSDYAQANGDATRIENQFVFAEHELTPG